jgi:hypothetical protein
MARILINSTGCMLARVSFVGWFFLLCVFFFNLRERRGGARESRARPADRAHSSGRRGAVALVAAAARKLDENNINLLVSHRPDMRLASKCVCACQALRASAAAV